MRNQSAYPINFLRELIRPKALLLWLAFVYFLCALVDSARASVHWGDAAVMTLAALALWHGKRWGYVLSALLAAPIFLRLVFGFPFASAGGRWTWLLALRWGDLGLIAMAGAVACYAVACLFLGFSSHKRPALS